MDDKFDKNDYEVLVKAINLIPEIKLCALILKHSRLLKISYPIKSYSDLTNLLNGEKLILKEGHSFSAAHIKQYVTKEQFPISDETELADVIYLGISRCREDMRWAAIAPPMAEELLILTKQGGY